MKLLAVGLEDGSEGAATSCVVTAEALRPPTPVHLKVERRSSGDLALGWVRRSRSGWNWTSDSDTALGEERETYRVFVQGSGFSRSFEVSVPSFVYSVAEQATDGAAGFVTFHVVQVGTHGASRAASIGFHI